MAQLKTLLAGRRLTYVSPDMTVTEVAMKMADAKIGAVVVLEDDKLLGIFTERDLLKCLAQMKQIGCRHMPVVEDDKLLGILSIRDLLRHQVSIKESELKMMNSLYRYQPPNMEI